MKNYKIGIRLSISFIILIFFILLISFISILKLKEVGTQVENLHKHPYTVSTSILNVKSGIISIHRDMKDITLSKNQTEINTILQQIDLTEKSIYSDFDIIEDRFLGNKEKVIKLRKLFTQWHPIRSEVIQLIAEDKRNRAIDITKKKGAEHVLKLTTEIQEFVNFANIKALDFTQKAKKEQNISFISLVSIVIISILVSIVFAIYMTRSIIYPIKEVVLSLKKISNKQIDFQITEKRNDEIGELYSSINEINTNFKDIILNINDTATAVSDASNQLSSASQDISSRANEQAATTEEVATSMEQMLAMINSNSQNAEQTGKSSTKSANEMKQSNEIFVQTIKSVSEISEKITIISEIADKTDILSINAAIEAARAGESGKGFSVVANEIRKLADKTKIASDEITKLSQTGQDISRIAGEKLEIIIPEIIKSAELVNNIVSAGKEQQSGVENINISVQQLTEITNENSASAEEMSASAEELSAQAEQLKSMIASSVNDITGVKQNNINIDNNKQEKQISERKNKGFNMIFSNKDKSDDDFETF